MSGTVAKEDDLSKLGAAIVEFKKRYELLTSPKFRDRIYATQDAALIDDYDSALWKADLIKSSIDKATGAWNKAKEWAGLGALPLIPILVVSGVTATVLGGIAMLDSFFQHSGAKMLQAENPGMTYQDALRLYDKQTESAYEKTLSTVQLALLVGGAFIFWRMLSK